ncbi:MAG: FAD-dependent oxidoreductase [Myxococcales bacterium]|nr:FAD-dependent oxidoreductase [Myxococcales bacterium]
MFFVEDCTTLSPTVRRLRLRPKDGFDYRAGQYIEIGFPCADGETPSEYFPFSLASSPTDRFLELCIRAVDGHFLVPCLTGLSPGDAVWVKGPGGRFLYGSAPSRPLVWIATGTGIAPLRSLFRSPERQAAHPSEDIMLFGCRNEEEILYREEWEQALGAAFYPILSQASDDWTGERGRIMDFLSRHPSMLAWSAYDYYICGQGEMLTSLKAFLSEQGVREESLHHERW